MAYWIYPTTRRETFIPTVDVWNTILVDTFESLPSTPGGQGDIAIVLDTGEIYRYVGTMWAQTTRAGVTQAIASGLAIP